MHLGCNQPGCYGSEFASFTGKNKIHCVWREFFRIFGNCFWYNRYSLPDAGPTGITAGLQIAFIISVFLYRVVYYRNYIYISMMFFYL